MQKRENPDYAELMNQLKCILDEHAVSTTGQIQNHLTQLSGVVSQLVGMNGMEHVLANGFDAISAQLAPLRELAPQRTALDPVGNEHLARVRASLKSPNWNGVNFLAVDRSATLTSVGETLDGMFVTVERRSALS